MPAGLVGEAGREDQELGLRQQRAEGHGRGPEARDRARRGVGIVDQEPRAEGPEPVGDAAADPAEADEADRPADQRLLAAAVKVGVLVGAVRPAAQGLAVLVDPPRGHQQKGHGQLRDVGRHGSRARS